MQVILKQDIPKVGHRFDVVTVSNGYANNFLFPQKLAEPALPHKVAELEKLKAKAKAEEEAKTAELKEKLEKINDTEIEMEAKSDEQGHLYKKINSKDIVETMKEKADIDLPETAILLDSPLTETGEHEINIEIVDEKITITLKIEREE